MKITEELELNDSFTWQWVRFDYQRENLKVEIEIIFKEGTYRHSRTFKFSIQQGLTKIETSDVYALLSTL